MGPCNWEIIRKIKQTLSIPVIANGGIATYDDCIKCLEYTGCDGVMSSESILEYPALFDNT
jgi:tRNA-dihydrouridine synthase